MASLMGGSGERKSQWRGEAREGRNSSAIQDLKTHFTLAALPHLLLISATTACESLHRTSQFCAHAYTQEESNRKKRETRIVEDAFIVILTSFSGFPRST
jgi:hypothetical protein